MTMPITFTYKQGVSLYFGSQLLGDDGLPTTGTGVDVECVAKHVETGETRTLESVWVDRAGGSVEFWAPGDGTCATWRLGTWEADVQASRAGVAPGGRALVEATETIHLVILERP